MPRTIIVGTKNSISAYTIDKELGPKDFTPIMNLSQANRVMQGARPEAGDVVIITYGFKIMPTSDALGIADTLIASGFDRNYWRYEG